MNEQKIDYVVIASDDNPLYKDFKEVNDLLKNSK